MAGTDIGARAIALLRAGAHRDIEARAWNFRDWQDEAQAFVDALDGLAALPDDGREGLDVERLAALGHKPLPDGRCEHRWRNRTNRAVRCPFLDGFRAALTDKP